MLGVIVFTVLFGLIGFWLYPNQFCIVYEGEAFGDDAGEYCFRSPSILKEFSENMTTKYESLMTKDMVFYGNENVLITR